MKTGHCWELFCEVIFRRLSWLSVNIILNIIAASVIAYYQDVMSAVIALAVFLPIISDMIGFFLTLTFAAVALNHLGGI